jgi:uncharacterized protein YacL
MQMSFKDISQFYNVRDYLPILNGVILTDLIVICLLLSGIIQSKVLRQWYHEYGIGAFLADVLIIVIGLIITRFIYPFFFSRFSILKFAGLAVCVQVIHDVLFYYFFKGVPRGMNRMLDTFKAYGKEAGYKAILSDSAMMVLSAVLASWFAGFSLNTNIILLILLFYLMPYLVSI